MAPSAVAKPYALPPESMIALTTPTERSGSSSAVSRVPGAPPRTSTPPTVFGGQRIAVQPVIASRLVACPTRIPGTAVRVLFIIVRDDVRVLCNKLIVVDDVYCLIIIVGMNQHFDFA